MKQRLDFLDGIRGFASLWVVLYHFSGLFKVHGYNELPLYLFGWMKYGHQAVSIFIFLSGFCLMWPIVSNPKGTLKGGLHGFFLRRSLRILPAYYASILLALGTTYFSAMFKSQIGIIDKSDLWQLNFTTPIIISHLFLVHHLFPNLIQTLSPVLWSIGVEWHIYFIFALILLPIFTVSKKNVSEHMALLLLLLVGAVLGYSTLLLPANINLSWASVWFIAIFTLGMSGAIIMRSTDNILIQIRSKTPWFLLGTIFGILTIMARVIGFHNSICDLMIGLSTGCFVIYMAKERLYEGDSGNSHNIMTKIFESKVFMRLGIISYSLYLIHSNIGTRMATFFATKNVSETAFLIAIWVLGLGLSLILSTVFYLLFEKPFLSLRSRAGANVS